MTGHDSELRAALRQLPAPEPSAELLPRILRSRAMGVRVISPTQTLALPWRGLAAAAVVVLLIGGSWIVSLSLSRLGRSPAMREPIEEFLRGTGMLPTRAPASSREIPPPKYELITSGDLDATRIKSGAWTYTVQKTTDDILIEQQGVIGVRLSRGTHLGSPTWMVSSARQVRGGPWSGYADTTQLDPASLRPLLSVAHGNRYRTRFLQKFSDDSGHEAIDRTGPMAGSWRGAVALPFSRDVLFINDWSTTRLAVLMTALPLTRGWRGSIYQIAYITQLGVKSATPIDLRVRGTDRVTVPAGSFDCWRVEVETHLWDIKRETWWVSRDNGWLIKKESRGSDYVATTRLATYEPGN